MKKQKILLAVILGSVLALLIMGCGPVGGTVILVNESSYELENVKISLGKSQTDKLGPGGSIKASVDKNIMGANVTFKLGEIISFPVEKKGKDLVEVPGYGTNWLLSTTFNSKFFSVNGGETIIITVKNKK